MRLDQAYEYLLFSPKWYHLPFIVLMLPFSIIYGAFMWLRRAVSSPKDFGISIVSVGNLIVGGSGKTPFTISLASRLDDVTIISRGYGRKSKGLVEVSCKGKILASVEQSGDEPMLMALSLPKASVIVSEDRHQAIRMAKENGAKLIILDDGFNRVEIKKFEIILEPEKIKNVLPFPAGPFREFWFTKYYADMVVKEGRDFTRVVEIDEPQSKMLLVTAIANPQRLDKYLPKEVVQKVYLKDHDYFDEGEIRKVMDDCGADSILCTSKDRVKMEGFDLPISELKLKLNIEDDIIKKIQSYIQSSL
ncbi:tetraacyldisaccharide 4'-kinase [Sulfurovum sp. zt1-1]|uniref:Tetraacyldisaccharide 4'-kinase n=1 Tax=Sulfurovum zhangzhouensis TaxID=3019067 RepID=A0ABT7QYX9_9BACT|nr:tetraacyldisaccharide 4'-kinase [Sulfurovum zhangzhouensis]MDM5272035.1 tetraacyldisaccharide 4'-kinase [Sulfurovum zhangzhouensis]